MAKAKKRTTLEALAKQRLAKLVQDFGLEVATSKPKEVLVDALASAEHPSLAEILEQLNREELKNICRAHGIDDSGKQRAAIVERILGEAPVEHEPDRATDPRPLYQSRRPFFSPLPPLFAAENDSAYFVGKPPPWLASLYELVEQGSIDEAIDLLFDHVNDLLFDDRADECDELLQAIDLDRLDTNLLVSLLSVTLPARAVLPSRPALVERVDRRLTELAPARVDRLLSGLR
ncbi:MAG: hypothetical protein R6X02_02005 [Enhygromyxa sp.]